MFKKQITSLALSLGLMLGAGSSAMAADAFFSVGVSMPTSLVSEATTKSDSTGDKETADSVSGQYVWLKLPFLVGVGYENYEWVPKDVASSEMAITNSLFDVFYQFPIPVVNFSLGAAFGSTSVSGDFSDFYEGDSASGWFWRLGIPIGLFDLHVSQHMLNSTLKGKEFSSSGVTYSAEDISMKMTTTAVGLSFGF